MGAWGHGLLQNDDIQDGLVEVIHLAEGALTHLRRRLPAENLAARAGGAVGILLHMNSLYSFNPENDFHQTLLAVLQRQEPAFDALPGEAGKILRGVLAGKGAELVQRPGQLGRPLHQAFFAARGRNRFPMERSFGKREPSLFAHPEAAKLVQEVADHCVSWADEGFADEEIVSYIWEEGGLAIASLATLLVLEPCAVAPDRFPTWKAQYLEAVARLEEEGPLEEYEKDFKEYLLMALDEGIRRYSKAGT